MLNICQFPSNNYINLSCSNCSDNKKTYLQPAFVITSTSLPFYNHLQKASPMYFSNAVLYFNIFQKCFQWAMSTREERNEAITVAITTVYHGCRVSCGLRFVQKL